MTTAELVRALVDGEGERYEYLALRADDRRSFAVGDVLPASRLWIDGTATDDEIDGTSGVEMRRGSGDVVSDDEIARALTAVQTYRYNGVGIVVIGGFRGIGGEDDGEVVIRDAVILGWVA